MYTAPCYKSRNLLLMSLMCLYDTPMFRTNSFTFIKKTAKNEFWRWARQQLVPDSAGTIHRFTYIREVNEVSKWYVDRLMILESWFFFFSWEAFLNHDDGVDDEVIRSSEQHMHTPLFSKLGKNAHAPHVNMGMLWGRAQPRVFDFSPAVSDSLLRLVG